MNNLRKARISKYDDGSGPFTTEVLFHKWGYTSIQNLDGNHITITAAIVEHLDGKVILYPPNRIKFETEAEG